MRRGYSLLAVLMLLALLGVAVTGLLFFIAQAAQTSSTMIERRRVFYACDGMGRQLARLGQAFLSRNTEEDVREAAMEAELRAALPQIVPDGMVVRPTDLSIPDRPLPSPVPVETITTGPFAGMQVNIQTIDMRLQATKQTTGAVCRAEQTLSLGRIALFQFFVFADIPLLDIVPPEGESFFVRGRIHTNGRVCLGGGPLSSTGSTSDGRFATRLDARITAVERVLHARDNRCALGRAGDDAGIINFLARGEQELPAPPGGDRLERAVLFDPLRDDEDSGCVDTGGSTPTCRGGWRGYTISHWLGRVQDTEHEVQELTLPIDPPVRHVQAGFAADGRLVLQQQQASLSRPNTRFLVEPVLTNDPAGFSRNKLAFKAQLRIIDGVWYVKDPGPSNDPADTADDGPWPGIPIWSDHPGEYVTAIPSMTREGVEGDRGIEVGQSDIRADIEERADADARLDKARWSRRAAMGATPTPRRFSYYAFVDRVQAEADIARGEDATLHPAGPGLQWGRACGGSVDEDGDIVSNEFFCDVDPPAVISYGVLDTVDLSGDGQTYRLPGFRLTSEEFTRRDFQKRATETGWCGGSTDVIRPDEVDDNQTQAAILPPVVGVNESGLPNAFSSFPMPGSPLPSAGSRTPRLGRTAAQIGAWLAGRTCADDSNFSSDGFRVRRRARLALLEGTRSGFRDGHVRPGDSFNGAQGQFLPMNFDLHAFQEALADRTPGELGSYFCRGCLWESFDGTVFITNTWRGSMLGNPFPDKASSPPPDPVVDNVRGPDRQPRARFEDRSTTGPLPYELCAANSDEDPPTAHAQVVGRHFLEADERDLTNADGVDPRAGFVAPFAGSALADETYLREFNEVPAFGDGQPKEPASVRLDPPEQPNDDVPNATMTGSFFVPDCAKYSLTAPPAAAPWAAARATVVRLVNARVINFNANKCGPTGNRPCLPRLSEGGVTGSVPATGKLRGGLNFITNLPLYVVGDVNQTSEVDRVQTGTRATDWIPVMLGADTVTTLSNQWDDEQSRWGVDTADRRMLPDRRDFTLRPAATTRYTMLVLTGINAAGVFTGSGIDRIGVSGGGLPNALRLLEDWSTPSARHIFRGAIVLGWNPVYTQWRVSGSAEGTYRPPLLRDWQFDRHLNATVNQPPDSPVFDISAIRSWRRE